MKDQKNNKIYIEILIKLVNQLEKEIDSLENIISDSGERNVDGLVNYISENKAIIGLYLKKIDQLKK